MEEEMKNSVMKQDKEGEGTEGGGRHTWGSRLAMPRVWKQRGCGNSEDAECPGLGPTHGIPGGKANSRPGPVQIQDAPRAPGKARKHRSGSKEPKNGGRSKGHGAMLEETAVSNLEESEPQAGHWVTTRGDASVRESTRISIAWKGRAEASSQKGCTLPQSQRIKKGGLERGEPWQAPRGPKEKDPH